MPAPVAVKALEDYRIWVRFDDGTEGDIDLSDFAGHGVFEAWNDRAFFEEVKIPEYEGITWPGDLSLCPDMLYMRLTGKTLEDIYPNLSPADVSV